MSTLPPELGVQGTALPGPLLNGIGGLLMTGLATWLWVGAADIDGAGDGPLGPDGFPRLVAALLGLTSLVLVAQSAWAARGGLRQVAIRVQRLPAVGAAILLVGAYPVLISYLGYYAATAVWMLPFLWVAGMRHPAGIVASAAGFLLFAKVLFQMVLGTPLP